MKPDVELLHAIVDEGDLIVRHKPANETESVQSATAGQPPEETHSFITSVSIRRLPEEAYTAQNIVSMHAIASEFEQDLS